MKDFLKITDRYFSFTLFLFIFISFAAQSKTEKWRVTEKIDDFEGSRSCEITYGGRGRQIRNELLWGIGKDLKFPYFLNTNDNLHFAVSSTLTGLDQNYVMVKFGRNPPIELNAGSILPNFAEQLAEQAIDHERIAIESYKDQLTEEQLQMMLSTMRASQKVLSNVTTKSMVSNSKATGETLKLIVNQALSHDEMRVRIKHGAPMVDLRNVNLAQGNSPKYEDHVFNYRTGLREALEVCGFGHLIEND
mgnify:CR=1 FL=1|jgi:hypothetical protein